MKRRDFLRCAALASAPMALGAAGSPRIPAGFLGATYSHAPAKLKLLMASADWEIVGVCDAGADGQRTAREAGANVISQEELLDRARVVVVESDVRDHAAHALLALRAGRHVHLEKPPATRLAEMQEMVALAREKKLLLQCGYMWRHHPGFRAIFDAVRAGWLGEVLMVRAFIGNLLAPERRPEWGEFAGGSMFELGSHLVDAIVRLLGKPARVTPFLHALGKDALKDNNVAVLEYERATAVLCNTARQSAVTPRRAFEVLGVNGTATLAPIEPPTLELDLVEPAGPYKKGRQQISLPAYQRYEADFAELATAVHGEGALSVSLDEELLVEETVLRASGMM